MVARIHWFRERAEKTEMEKVEWKVLFCESGSRGIERVKGKKKKKKKRKKGKNGISQFDFIYYINDIKN